jgi:hypothetical protein
MQCIDVSQKENLKQLNILIIYAKGLFPQFVQNFNSPIFAIL